MKNDRDFLWMILILNLYIFINIVYRYKQMPIFSDKAKKKVYLRRKSSRLQGYTAACFIFMGLMAIGYEWLKDNDQRSGFQTNDIGKKVGQSIAYKYLTNFLPKSENIK